MLSVNLYPNWEVILEDLSEIYDFQYVQTGIGLNSYDRLQNSYQISPAFFARKRDLDEYIQHQDIGSSEYARSSVLYSLYACSFLKIGDIEYPTYQDWKDKHNATIDHILPKRWFPRFTFDCSNWQPMPIKENKNKGDDFLDEGIYKLRSISQDINKIKSKYQ
jgi:hypothetical protein